MYAPAALDALASWLLDHFPGRCWLGVEQLHLLSDEAWLQRLRSASASSTLPSAIALVAVGDVHFHVCSRIVDDTGFQKKGRHSVGVARQHCGVLGKQDNCPVAVSVSLASTYGSLPVAWQLYLPRDWADDPERRKKAGVPDELQFSTKSEIATLQLRGLLAEGAPRHCVLADAGHGVDTAFREVLSEMELRYVVGVASAVVVWPLDVKPSPSASHGV